jgi:hypothetical protein
MASKDDGSVDLEGNLCITLLSKRRQFSATRDSARRELSGDVLAEVRELFGNEFTIQTEDLIHGGSSLSVF